MPYKKGSKKCPEKIRYYTPNEAWMAALKFFLKFRTEQTPYLCEDCLEYHLTSKESVVPKFIRDAMENAHPLQDERDRNDSTDS